MEDVLALNFSWLLKLRWVSILGQLAVVSFSERVLHVSLPHAPLAGIVALQLASNLAGLAWARGARPIPEWLLAAPMALDLVLLTWMLALTGGAANPFTVLYLVSVALAGVVLQSRWTWALVVLALLCFGALSLAATPPGLDRHGASPAQLQAQLQPLRLHLEWLWLTFGVASALIVHFVHRSTRVLGERERALEEARRATARREKLASLASLAAGAAHELGTPLSTIALAAKELERRLERGPKDADAIADARLIREQVERCRNILWQLAADAGESAGEPLEPLGAPQLVAASLSELEERQRVQVRLGPGVDQELLRVPRRALTHALKALVKNALQASPADRTVHLGVDLSADGWRLEVKDAGVGMPRDVLARAGEPFFTTKGPGQGMGLGLFLTRALMEQLGGHLELSSTPGSGTTATLVLPRSTGAPPPASSLAPGPAGEAP
jgi:two-component system sensor histidine kinase RegB